MSLEKCRWHNRKQEHSNKPGERALSSGFFLCILWQRAIIMLMFCEGNEEERTTNE